MKKCWLLPVLSLLGLSACKRDYNESKQHSENTTAPSESKSVKTEGLLFTCESHGAKLVIETVPGGAATSLEARLSGKVAEYLRDEQGKPVLAQGGGYNSGKTWETKKQLPKTLVHNFGKAEAPVVIIQQLSKREVNSQFLGYFKGQHDPSVVKEKTGYKVVIPHFEMTGAHTTATYEYANWFFAEKDCR